MAETIESFVARLKHEGVDAGRAAAEQHLAKARQEADAILADARAHTEKIVATARAQADGLQAKARTDLELAARDLVLRLHESLSRAVREILAAGVRQPLSDPKFLGNLLHEIVLQYVRADIERTAAIRINVTPEMRERLAEWAMALAHKPELGGTSLDLRGTLAEAGFEYQADGANVEVTVESVADALAELVNPALRDVLRKAMTRKK
jgi:V/A-type H+-transporting ATPase subunit E